MCQQERPGGFARPSHQRTDVWQHFLKGVTHHGAYGKDCKHVHTRTRKTPETNFFKRCKISCFSFQAENDGAEQLFVKENFFLCRKEENFEFKVSHVLQSDVTAPKAHERGE